MSYRIRRYGSRWIVVNGNRRHVAYRYHRYWISAFLELLRLRGWF